MYEINGVPLDNDPMGWRLLRRSQALTTVGRSLSNVVIPGRSGVLPGVPSFGTAPMTTLVIKTPLENLEALYSLFLRDSGQGTFSVEGDTSRVAVFEVSSIDPQGVGAGDEYVNVTVLIRFPSADWRGTDLVVEGPITPASGVHDLEIMAGISSPIVDGGVFIGGNFGNFSLRDEASGSWLKTVTTWPHVADTGLLYVGSTGQAFRATTAAPWTPTTDMSQYVTVSGGGGFRVTPTWDTDPSDRIAKLKLTTTNQSGVTFSFRALNAYAIRGV